MRPPASGEPGGMTNSPVHHNNQAAALNVLSISADRAWEKEVASLTQPIVHPGTEFEAGALTPAAVRVEHALWDVVRTPTILVVNDAEIDRRLLKAMLKAEPYRILEARRASEAVVLIDQEPIDLIILEMINPELSGLTFF